MELDQEIDTVMRRLDQGIADRDVVKAALKQLVRAHLGKPAQNGLVLIEAYIDEAFIAPLSKSRATGVADVLKARIAILRGSKPAPVKVHWI